MIFGEDGRSQTCHSEPESFEGDKAAVQKRLRTRASCRVLIQHNLPKHGWQHLFSWGVELQFYSLSMAELTWCNDPKVKKHSVKSHSSVISLISPPFIVRCIYDCDSFRVSLGTRLKKPSTQRWWTHPPAVLLLQRPSRSSAVTGSSVPVSETGRPEQLGRPRGPGPGAGCNPASSWR